MNKQQLQIRLLELQRLNSHPEVSLTEKVDIGKEIDSIEAQLKAPDQSLEKSKETLDPMQQALIGVFKSADQV